MVHVTLVLKDSFFGVIGDQSFLKSFFEKESHSRSSAHIGELSNQLKEELQLLYELKTINQTRSRKEVTACISPKIENRGLDEKIYTSQNPLQAF